MRKMISAVLVSIFFAAAANAQVDFDRGVDTRQFVTKAVSSGVSIPKPVPGFTHYSRDCVRFSFGPSDAALASDRVWLRSTEYVQECHNVPVQQCHTVMVPGPNNTQVPQQQCHTVYQQQCYERPGMTWSATAQVKMAARKLFPWERESFDVCLDGPWMDIYAHEAAYKYSVNRQGNYDTLFELAAQSKIAMKSDENGINYADFNYADGKFNLKAADKWAKEYAGEKVAITVELYKEGWWIFNGYLGSKEFTFDAADLYTMSFTEKDLEKALAEEDDSFRGAKKYYAKWSFKRMGPISKDNVVKKDKTPSITK